ncbi:hypothetical protein [Burkholderia plantarii]|uniref:Uncharacterized protein n=1 Tax=Burkholderia plantarii TaxID=41899 RepID=A0A0B6S519_BURPL|nr:hypothetical protein [Burkholderia plantarii]AJK50773.1 hypothetical protein BGL_2c27190 [Burkholderia plantarii]ALK34918.1 hypothetical protein bpln_2g27250 [Burkholderia plantarii]MBI0331200.1 hypothetical protein [Burkholderia plantarii]WLE61195.1 hypothetical protein GIY62_27320 [Burkholderia plantarii]GLZ18635.1 hypothetical protein Bpla01_21650 [Burkholderia plantarii]
MPSSSSFNTYSNLLNPEFRAKIDAMLGQFEAAFYEKIEKAEDMLKSDSFDMGMYKRHNVETILRISLKRAVDPLIANYWASRDPQLCKEWGLYGAEEGRHDRMFARDLHEVGMTDEEIYATRPTFATELLNGYFYYTMATEGPLASMVSGFYLEYVAGRTQPDWLDSMEVHLGKELTKGARRHLAQDLEDDHVNMVWNMIMRTIKGPADEARFIEHLVKINALFVSYFVEVARSVRVPAPNPLEAAMTAPVAALTVAAETSKALA